jgi:hypothetical protein
MTKRSRILIAIGILIVVVVGFVVLAFVLIGSAFEPMDPFPRAELMANCSNNTSVVLYQRKTGWFADETEWSVKQFDGRGKLIRRQVLFTLPHWNDSEMHRRPEEFCDDKYWTRTKQTFLLAAQPNKSLDARGGSV